MAFRFQRLSIVATAAVAWSVVGSSSCLVPQGSSLNPETDCLLRESECDETVARMCTRIRSNKTPEYQNVLQVTDCAELGMVCVSGDQWAGCALRDEPCDPAAFTGECDDEFPVLCEPLSRLDVTNDAAEYDGENFYPVRTATRCTDDSRVAGNSCFEGSCVLGDIECDPAVYAPSCDDGFTVECAEFTASRWFPVRRNGCPLGTCHEVDGVVGCGSEPTTCTVGDARCDADDLLECFPALHDTSTAETRGIVTRTSCVDGCLPAAAGEPARCE